MANTPKIEPNLLRSSSRRFHRFGNQSFRRLAKRSADVGLTFTDDQFKQNDRHVYQTSAFRSRFNIGKVVWKRPKQLLKENDFNFDSTLLPIFKTDHNHLFVGHSPNSWLVAAALAIGQHRSLFEQLVNIDEQHFRDQGIARFTIWQMGVWHKVVVDDRLPSIDSEPIFTRPIWSYSSWWIPMLEKAYAKLYGSYEAMVTNGSLHSALIDFSGGGSVESIDLLRFGYSSEQLWHIISREFQSKSLLILKTKEFKPIGSAPFGLVSNRYYLIRNIKKPMGTLKRLLSSNSSSSSSSTHHSNQDNLPLLITNTIADGVKNCKSSLSMNPKKGLQEFWILSNNITNLFDTLTICRPFQYHKDSIHRLIVNKSIGCDNSSSSSLQFRFDVRPMSNSSSAMVTTDSSNGVGDGDTNGQHKPHHHHSQCVDVHFNLIQKNSPIIPIGFRIYSIELNRKFKVHQFSSLPLITTIDPVQSRNLIVTISLPANARYLLKPICPEISTLLVSIYSPQINDLRQLTMDMPRHQLLSFMQPVYPSAMTRIHVLGCEGLERQDRFGTANPYCIIRCGRKYVKSSIEYETLMPVWNNFSAIFYHRDIDKMEPIWIEIWNRGILVDYFLGAIKFIPKLTMIIENDNHHNHNYKEEPVLEQQQQQQDVQSNDMVNQSEEISMPDITNKDHSDFNYQMNIETINDDDVHNDRTSAKSAPSLIENQDLTCEQQQQQNVNENDVYGDNDDDIICLQLMDKKGHTKRSGFVLLRSETVEDLKYF
ncbi:calpain-6 isoform X1 [Dermatophagoides farinae]|uniref:calpain-6 isoform X1 n=1 Tax=Dermatophagoides farinae TaxID=6954 RepID=UPI003F60BAC4